MSIETFAGNYIDAIIINANKWPIILSNVEKILEWFFLIICTDFVNAVNLFSFTLELAFIIFDFLFSCRSPTPSSSSSKDLAVQPSTLSAVSEKKESCVELPPSLSNYCNDKLIAHVQGWQTEHAERQVRFVFCFVFFVPLPTCFFFI